MPARSISPRHFNFFRLLTQSPDFPVRTVIFYALLSGLSNAVLISVLNGATYNAEYGTISLFYLALFAITMAIFFISKRYILTKSTMLIEEVVHSIRISIVNKIRRAELTTMESLGRANIYTRVTHDTNFVSQTAGVIINAIQGGILVFFTMLYIAYLSLPAFLVTVGSVAAGAWYFLTRQKKINEEIQRATDLEAKVFDALDHVIDGFKEIRINEEKNEDLYRHLSNLSYEAKNTKLKTGLRFVVGFMFSETVFYLLLAGIIFVVPQYSEVYTLTLSKLTAAILFIIGPIENMVGSVSVFTRANVAIENIWRLEEELDRRNRDIPNPEFKPELEQFEYLEFENVVFEYLDDRGQSTFRVGPVSFRVDRNETLFLVGGNGSGKSTLLKLLTGLYVPQSGVIRANGVVIDPSTIGQYRDYFTSIFTDFHLFDRLYGLGNVRDEEVHALISQMKLTEKTGFKDGRFTQLKLSTGQRKRLALIVSILEDKPVLVYDEVAADQDAEFKRYFYEELLVELHKKGKTIIMVTHDDRWFYESDRVLKMDVGTLSNGGQP